jgi:hypothetical protein
MKRLFRIALSAAALPLAACSSLGSGEYGISDYTLVRVHRVSVGDGGAGTSMSGPCGGVSGGGSVGWPGWDGCGVVGGSAGLSGNGGSCCIETTLLGQANARLAPRVAGLPHGPSLL